MQKRTEKIMFYISEEEKKNLIKKAQKLGLSMSDYLRFKAIYEEVKTI